MIEHYMIMKKKIVQWDNIWLLYVCSNTRGIKPNFICINVVFLRDFYYVLVSYFNYKYLYIADVLYPFWVATKTQF